MKILIVGPGRIGMPIARCSRENGHTVFVLSREGSQKGDHAKKDGFVVDTIANIESHSEVDLIILCVAFENRTLFQDTSAFANAFVRINKRFPSVPLASIVGPLNMSQLSKIFGSRPIARFFCSAAITNSHSLRFYDENSDERAIELLSQALPSEEWRAIPSTSFERFGTLLTLAALISVPMIRLKDILEPLTSEEEQFLRQSVVEGIRLLSSHSGDPVSALESALTPGGVTEGLIQQLFRDVSLPESGRENNHTEL